MKEALLVTREVNCSTLTKEQFVTMMGEDLTNALNEDIKIFRPIEEALYNERKRSDFERTEKRAKEYATKRYKSVKWAENYIKREMENLAKSYESKWKQFSFYPVSYFDFDVEPWSNGISGYCILHPCETKERLEQCFEYIKDNEYFKAAKGWQLIDHRSSRPEIKLILDEEMETKYKNAERSLGEAIANFYAGSNYWGD